MIRPNLHDPGAVLGTVKAKPVIAERCSASTGGPGGPALTAPARVAVDNVQAGTKERLPARTKELTK